MIHAVKGFSIVSEAEMDVFLEFPCFLCDTKDVGNLISGSSSSSKSNLNIWKFLVYVLLKLGLKDFEYYIASVKLAELYGSLSILWHCLSLGLEWKMAFSSPVATAEFSKLAGVLRVAL